MTKELYPLFGIVTVLNTPFTSDNIIDTKALRRHVRYALDAGVAGFLVPAMAAEVYKLSKDERLLMVDTVLDEAGGRVPVIAGAGETDLQKAGHLLKEYTRRGCRNVLFQLPYTDDGSFYNNFMKLAEAGPDMIMLQDWDASGYGLTDELICRLFEEVPAFRCLKIETIPAGVKYSRIIELTQNRLHVSGGWAVTQMIEGLKRGVHAFMPTAMHYSYTKVFNSYREGRMEEAEQIFRKLLPVLAFSNQHLDISIHFFKRLLYKQGVYPTSALRNPFLPFDSVHEEIADSLIEYAIGLEEQHKNL